MPQKGIETQKHVIKEKKSCWKGHSVDFTVYGILEKMELLLLWKDQ